MKNSKVMSTIIGVIAVIGIIYKIARSQQRSYNRESEPALPYGTSRSDYIEMSPTNPDYIDMQKKGERIKGYEPESEEEAEEEFFDVE